MSLVPGQWPDVELDGDFSAILVYSVLIAFRPRRRVRVHRSLPRRWPARERASSSATCRIPTPSARFAGTEFRAAIHGGVPRAGGGGQDARDPARDEIFAAAPTLDRYLDDAFIAELFLRYRGRGAEVYVLPQPSGLPFSYTREDVLIQLRP